jgi:hypothetical protein
VWGCLPLRTAACRSCRSCVGPAGPAGGSGIAQRPGPLVAVPAHPPPTAPAASSSSFDSSPVMCSVSSCVCWAHSFRRTSISASPCAPQHVGGAMQYARQASETSGPFESLGTRNSQGNSAVAQCPRWQCVRTAAVAAPVVTLPVWARVRVRWRVLRVLTGGPVAVAVRPPLTQVQAAGPL